MEFTFGGDEYIFSLEVSVVDVFALEISTATGKLKKEGDGFFFGKMAVHGQMGFEIALWLRKYPPEQN